ncbi:hypothetical protein GO730_38875 [Spirosoma sp. HMF3257]|uniref:Uncharacterized protein n=1 Tax=Spirosoma telluris TaxID=2183553 RepID=A0A327NCD9_9BACT|nr:hypothetical protein [Spirosoma telluris]RAI72867.1 hypothetical protein HMF3257_38805 [Spirosoma telluris]
MELTPGTQNRKQEPRQWQVGDLISHKQTGIIALILAVWDITLVVIARTGTVKRLSKLQANTLWKLLHNTGISYQFKNQEQVQRDYQNGLFIPFFEIL